MSLRAHQEIVVIYLKLVSNENKGEALAEMSEEIRETCDELIDQDGTEGLAKSQKT